MRPCRKARASSAPRGRPDELSAPHRNQLRRPVGTARSIEERYGRGDLREAAEIAQEKLRTIEDFWPFAGFLFERREIDPAAWEKVMKDGAAENLEQARAALAEVPDWDKEAIEAALRGVVDARGVKPKEVFQPVRVAISGTTVSPGIFESLAVLGREETLVRIDAALDLARKTA